jgi:hypothetical protein
VKPLLYAPNGNVIAVETTNEDRKDAILIELFGMLAGVPACLDHWRQRGGIQVATSQMIGAIVEVIGKERLEQTWGVTLTEKSAPAPKTFADVERDAGHAAAIARRGPGDASARATRTGLTEHGAE